MPQDRPERHDRGGRERRPQEAVREAAADPAGQFHKPAAAGGLPRQSRDREECQARRCPTD
jgi:hypothetical protein